MKKKIQHPFRGFDHDSLQFHFFCENLIGACRLFYTKSLCHSSLWIYIDGKINEIFSSTNPIKSKNDNSLDIKVGNLSIKELNDNNFKIVLEDKKISILLHTITLETWNDTISNVIHLPNLKAKVFYEGKFYDGIGYSKRYSWKHTPRYWGYRFIQGFDKNDKTSIWTAEATFGLKKYDYCKILKTSGKLINTIDDLSYHRQNYMCAKTTNGAFKIELKEINSWGVNLKSDNMDSFLQQRLCKFKAKLKNKKMYGYAINETCYGTLG